MGGYTMAYTQTRDLTTEEWAELRAMVLCIVKQFDEEVSMGLDWSMDEDHLLINGRGEDLRCENFFFCHQPITHPIGAATHVAIPVTRSMYESIKRFYEQMGTMYLPDLGHLASRQRYHNKGPDETPWFCNQVQTRRLPYDLVGKAVLTVLHARFPGSVIIGDESEGELPCSAEEAWAEGVRWATKALPSYAFVPNLGRAFPKRMWDKVRRFVRTVLPAFGAAKLRAAARVYAAGAPAVDALQANFEHRAAKSVRVA